MTALWLSVEQTFGLAILLALPMVVAAAVGAVSASVLGAVTGLQDGTISVVARMLAVVVAVLMMSSTLAGETTTLTKNLWAQLSTVGQRP